MIFSETAIDGTYLIELERRTDRRGSFARLWCRQEFQAHGLTSQVSQMNVSTNTQKGTLRGMHFQRPPHGEAKVVSCLRGAIYDVVLDLRPHSPTYLQWGAFELTEANRRMIYVPEGCAHGFQTLRDNTELLYFMSEAYSIRHSSGVRYNDSAFSIIWPLEVESISDADRAWPDYPELSKTETLNGCR
jgi:dTDP-4-dehydrorhamnose 3,5-epimerase